MSAPRLVTSLQNERIKAIRALDMRKSRKESGLFVAEGAAILISAREQGHVPETLVRLRDATHGPAVGDLIAWALAAGADVIDVTLPVMEKLAHRDNPQTLMGVFRQRWSAPPDLADRRRAATWIALEEVRDPGNLGTILRTAHAAGAGGVLLVGACCDPFARECVRATMGSIFAVPVARATPEAFARLARDWPGDVVGTHLAGREDFRARAYRLPALLVMGSEGPGLGADTVALCTRLVRIPMAPGIDSLNLAVATALALYQILGPELHL